MFRRYGIALLLAVLTSDCAPSRVIAPLEVGTGRTEISAGGPMSTFTAGVPAPMISISHAHGVAKRVSVFGGVNVTAAIFGNILLDPGTTIGLWSPRGALPGVSVTGALNTLVAVRDDVHFRMFPELDLNLYWRHRYGSPYLSFGNWFDPHPWRLRLRQGAMSTRSIQTQSKEWVPVVAVGHRFDMGRRWRPVFELRYMAGNVNTTSVEENRALGIAGRGAFGIYIGLGLES